MKNISKVIAVAGLALAAAVATPAMAIASTPTAGAVTIQTVDTCGPAGPGWDKSKWDCPDRDPWHLSPGYSLR